MKPILPFKAVEEGNTVPTLFSTDKELSSEMELIALELGCLSTKDAQAVRKRLEATSNEAKVARDADDVLGKGKAAPTEKAEKKPRGKASSVSTAEADANRKDEGEG